MISVSFVHSCSQLVLSFCSARFPRHGLSLPPAAAVECPELRKSHIIFPRQAAKSKERVSSERGGRCWPIVV